MRFDLTDDEWAELEPLMPAKRKSARVDDRRVVNAILHVLRTGIPWRDLPEAYGPYTTAYNRFNRWAGRGIWKRVFERLASTGPRPEPGGGRPGKESGSAGAAGRQRYTRSLMERAGL